jgi:hypothetical protein
MRETYAVVLLKRKARKLGHPAESDGALSPMAAFQQSLVRPLKLLFLSPIVLLLSIFTAVVFGLIFLLFTTFPLVFEEQYGFGTGVSGLSYLGLGCGMMAGVILFGSLSDKIVKKLAGSGEMQPEYRLPLMVLFIPLIPAGFFWYGWSAYHHYHWFVTPFTTTMPDVLSSSSSMSRYLMQFRPHIETIAPVKRRRERELYNRFWKMIYACSIADTLSIGLYLSSEPCS